MSQDAKLSPIEQLRLVLPDLPARLRDAGRYIVEHQFDATTQSMRDFAAAAVMQPAVFTRLAKALGWAGWEEFRGELVEARRAKESEPFSSRLNRSSARKGSVEELAAAVLASDADAVAQIEAEPVARAAKALHAAERIWIVGFRSCRSVAELLLYQLRMFRGNVRLVGIVGTEDLDFGEFKKGDAVVVFGFAPYSRSLMSALREARREQCTLVLIDQPNSPNAEGANHYIAFEALATPAFFPSLTGAVSAAQALAGAVFKLGGEKSSDRLRKAEARLSAMAEYVPEDDSE